MPAPPPARATHREFPPARPRARTPSAGPSRTPWQSTAVHTAPNPIESIGARYPPFCLRLSITEHQPEEGHADVKNDLRHVDEIRAGREYRRDITGRRRRVQPVPPCLRPVEYVFLRQPVVDRSVGGQNKRERSRPRRDRVAPEPVAREHHRRRPARRGERRHGDVDRHIRVDESRKSVVFHAAILDRSAPSRNSTRSASRRLISPASTLPPAMFQRANSAIAPCVSPAFSLRSKVEVLKLPLPMLNTR